MSNNALNSILAIIEESWVFLCRENMAFKEKLHSHTMFLRGVSYMIQMTTSYFTYNSFPLIFLRNGKFKIKNITLSGKMVEYKQTNCNVVVITCSLHVKNNDTILIIKTICQIFNLTTPQNKLHNSLIHLIGDLSWAVEILTLEASQRKTKPQIY